MKYLILSLLVVTTAATGSLQPSSPAHIHYKFGLIAKSENNPVFIAARVGAEDAARDLAARHNCRIDIVWRTPADEDAQKQASFIDQLVVLGVDGLAISCTDPSKVAPAIDKAVARGIPVACFDSDAPATRRFVYHGSDDELIGRTVVAELAKAIGSTGGPIAVLAGNQTAPNLRDRVRGARAELANHPNLRLVDIYYHREAAQDAAAKIREVQTSHPEIAGWAMVGGWPLFSDALMDWRPGEIKIVAVDALPAQLKYVEKGIVQALVAQRVYDWGTRSVELLFAKAHENRTPATARDLSQLDIVTRDNVAAYAKNWNKWLGSPSTKR